MKDQPQKLEEKMGFLPVYGSQSELNRAQGQEIEAQSKNSQPYLAPPLNFLTHLCHLEFNPFELSFML